MTKAIMRFLYVLAGCGWLGIAVLPYFGISFHPFVVAVLCVNMSLTFFRWAE